MSLSKKRKQEIIENCKNINQNSKKFLYLLQNLGPLRFEKIVKYSDLSRATVAKYLKRHLTQNNLKKELTDGYQSYIITDKGKSELGEKIKYESLSQFYEEINEDLSNLREMVAFYEEMNFDESIIFPIVEMILKIGDKFFQIEQTRDLYLTLYFIFLNHVLTPEYKFELNMYCEELHIKDFRLRYYIDKIMSMNLGFYMFERKSEIGEDIFFFHKEDILGLNTNLLVEEHLTHEIIHLFFQGERTIYDIDQMAREIAEKLVEQSLIWEMKPSKGGKILSIREQFELLIIKMLVKKGLDIGMPKVFLKNLILQSDKLSKNEQISKSIFNIIEGSNRYEDLNLISFPEQENVPKTDNFLKPIQGFCPNCGKIVLDSDLSNFCNRCDISFENKTLIKSIDEAKRANIRFKETYQRKESAIDCPNPKCDSKILVDWDECPLCRFKINIKTDGSFVQLNDATESQEELKYTKEFRVNNYITLRLVGKETVIFVNDERFMICKKLLFNIPHEDLGCVSDIASIDDFVDEFGEETPSNSTAVLTAEEEFWGHCSNIKAWADNNYDTRLLRMTIAFPLLKKLTSLNDKNAEIVFKEEIARRMDEGNKNVGLFLLKNKYLDYFNKEELNGLNFSSITAYLSELIENSVSIIKDITRNYSSKENARLKDLVEILRSHWYIWFLIVKNSLIPKEKDKRINFLSYTFLNGALVIDNLELIEEIFLHINLDIMANRTITFLNNPNFVNNIDPIIPKSLRTIGLNLVFKIILSNGWQYDYDYWYEDVLRHFKNHNRAIMEQELKRILKDNNVKIRQELYYHLFNLALELFKREEIRKLVQNTNTMFSLNINNATEQDKTYYMEELEKRIN